MSAVINQYKYAFRILTNELKSFKNISLNNEEEIEIGRKKRDFSAAFLVRKREYAKVICYYYC